MLYVMHKYLNITCSLSLKRSHRECVNVKKQFVSQGTLLIEEVLRISVDRCDRALGQRIRVKVTGGAAEKYHCAFAYSAVQSVEQFLGRHNGRRILREELRLHGDNK